MSKTLYEEALADVKQLKEVAEANAKRAVMDSVTPKIKELLESQLFGEQVDGEVEECDLEEVEQFGSGHLGKTDPSVDNGPASLPIDSEEESPEAEGTADEGYELTSESIDSLSELSNPSLTEKAEIGVFRLVDETNKLLVTPTQSKLTRAYSDKIAETIQRIEDIYSYLRESSDFSRKSELENRLESCFEVLSAVKESTMRMKDLLSRERMMEETDLTGLGDESSGSAPAGNAPATGSKELVMKVTGLPDDVELDKLNIDLISDEDEDDASAASPPELAAGPTPETSPMESVEMDEDEMMEGDDMEDANTDEISEMEEDDVVEISETMLKRELARLKGLQLSEMDGDVLDDFGGGEDEGEPFLDGEVSTADKDNMVKQSNKKVGSTNMVKTPPKGRVAEAKRAIAARRAKNVRESSNNEGFKQLAESRAAQVESLRKQLTETNLLNAKLLQANKLLQLEGLSAKQKSYVIDKLDEAQTLREVKLVYESLVRAIKAPKKTVTESTEGRAVIAGSSSRTTSRSSSSAVQPSGDSYETSRWAELAGIKRK